MESPQITQAGDMVTFDVELVNTGNRPLKIEKVRPGCGCTIATFTEGSISPGHSGNVSLKMNLRRLDRIISQQEFAGGFRNVDVTADVFGDFVQDTSAKFLPIRVRHRVRMPVQLTTPLGIVVGPLDLGEQHSEHEIPVLLDAGVIKIDVDSLIAGCRVEVDIHQLSDGEVGKPNETDGRHNALIRVSCDHAMISEVMKGDSSVMRLMAFHCSDEQGQAFPEVKLPLTVSVDQPLKIRPRHVLFGPMQPAQPITRTIHVESDQPVASLSVERESDACPVQCEIKTVDLGKGNFDVSVAAVADTAGTFPIRLSAIAELTDGGVRTSPIFLTVHVRGEK